MYSPHDALRNAARNIGALGTRFLRSEFNYVWLVLEDSADGFVAQSPKA